jgi:hypothetical protein
MPCCCHVLNNFLKTFLSEIRHLSDPVFRITGVFRSASRFRNFLIYREAPLVSIPTYTEVRWYSAYELFRALRILWPFMLDFVHETNMHVPDLTDEVVATIEGLEIVFLKFMKAQQQLESDSFATGSTFAGHLMGIRRRVQDFKKRFGVKTNSFGAYVQTFLRCYHRQWLVLVLQTILNPALRLDKEVPIDEQTQVNAIALLTDLVRIEINQAQAREVTQAEEEADEPSSGNFLDFPSSGRANHIGAEVQVSTYLGLRSTGAYDLELWSLVRAEMVELRIVALKILSILTTSASAERAFSVGALLCGDYQMAMSAATVSTRLIVQANWPVASGLVSEVLSDGPRGWAAWQKSYEAKKKRFIRVPDVAVKCRDKTSWGDFGDLIIDEAELDPDSSDDSSDSLL